MACQLLSPSFVLGSLHQPWPGQCIPHPPTGPPARPPAGRPPSPQGRYSFKLLAVDVPSAVGGEQRIFLVGDEAVYARGGVLAELRDPFTRVGGRAGRGGLSGRRALRVRSSCCWLTPSLLLLCPSLLLCRCFSKAPGARSV